MAKKSVIQLSNELIALSEELKRLNTQLNALKKGTSTWTDTLLKVEKQQNAVAKSKDTLAIASQKLNTANLNHAKSIEASNVALEKANKIYKQSTSLLKEIASQNERIAKLEKQLESYRRKIRENSNKMAQDIEKARIKYIENLEIQAFKSRIKRDEALNKERQRLAKAAEDAEKARIKRIEDFEIQAFKSRINRDKRQAREQAREDKKNDFGGAFTGSFTPQKIGSTLGTITRFLGVGGVVFGAINGLKQITTESIKVFIDLERQFASLSAISGATSEQMTRLQNTTFEVASSTGYAVGEIIQLESSLIKLGIPIDDVESSIKIVAISARAMGEDLSAVGEILFKISNQFGLTQSEISSTASTLVKSVNESALTFQEFGTAIQYAGPIANQVGLTFRETAGYMEILSNAGFKASKIGTGLRDLFVDLKQPGETLSTTIQKLANENISLSQAVDLVGKTSAAQLFVLLRNADAVKELSEETIDANDAMREMSELMIMNAKNMNTTQGRIDALGTAWQRYQFRIGGAITSTELFLDLLGLLDKKSEQSARAFKIISEMDKGQFERLSSSYSRATTDQQRSNVAYMGLPMSEKEDLRSIYQSGQIRTGRSTIALIDKEKYNTFEKFLVGVTSELLPASQDALIALVGLNKELSGSKKIADEQARVQDARIEQRDKYQQQYLELEKQTGKVQEKNAESLLTTVSEENKLLKEKIQLEEDAARLSNRPENADNDILRARLSENQNLISRISELIATESKTQAELDKAQREREEAEIKRLKRLIEERKRYYKEVEDSLKIELELAKINGDSNKIAEIEIRLIALRSRAFKDLTNAINSSSIIKEDQKFNLLGDISNFKVNEDDVISSISKIASTFQETIASKGIFQAEIIGKQIIQQFIDSLGDAVTPEQRKQVEEILNSFLFGKGQTELKTKNGKQSKRATMFTLNDDGTKRLSDEFLAELKKIGKEAAEALTDIIEDYQEVQLQNLVDRLNAEKEAIQERYDFEEKALKGQVDNQLITQAEYERKLELAKRKRIDKENQIEKSIFEAQQKRDRQAAGLGFIETLANIALNNYSKFDSATATVLSVVAGAVATAQYSAKLSAINQRKFYPTRFAEGGLVNGPSHAEGGVPFSVSGRGGYEMEGGEFIVNKEATKKNFSLLRQINDSVKPSTYSVGRKFASGGLVTAEQAASRQLDLLESIAMATTGTYSNTSKPVRAFITQADLRTDETERRIRNRNTSL